MMTTLVAGATTLGGSIIKQALKTGMGGLGSFLGGGKKETGK
jgi:hypothetical protein